MKKRLPLIIFFLVLLCSSHSFADNSKSHNKCVVLLHGLGRTHVSMSKLAIFLRKQHYYVINESYPSLKKSISAIAETAIPHMLASCERYHPDEISFVTHSLGGVVLRMYLHKHTIKNLKHIVMLAPPNHGSHLANIIHHRPIFTFILGPAAQELTTTELSTPNQLPSKLDYPVGILAGRRDKVVSISNTRLSDMDDFMILPLDHTRINRNKATFQQILYFLRHNNFYRQT